MPELRMKRAERNRQNLTKEQQKRVRNLYKRALKDVEDWSDFLKDKNNVSSVIRKEYLEDMEKNLKDSLLKIGTETETIIRDGISSTATDVVADANRILTGFGVKIQAAYSFVPSDVVQAITTGQIYDGDWTLSKAIWKMTKKSQQDIHEIIARGVAENKSSYEIAKELEKYVNPSAAKPWDWGRIYPGTSKMIDYNAQRLARTLVSHAYQQSFVRTTIDNPFFEGYRWLTANNHRVCPLCRERAETVHEEGLPEGVYAKDDLPLDHPNGQCTHSVYMTKSTDQIVNELAAWAHGKSNPGLDKFARSLGYTINEVKNSIF